MYRRVGGLIVLGWLAGCAGTDTGNPGRGFNPPNVPQVSHCKSKGLPPDAGLVTQALTASDAHTYDGLQCLRWEREGNRILFEAFNFTGGCEVAWAGKLVRKPPAGLELLLTNPTCAVAACGSCLYDASFELDIDSTELGDNATVDLTTADCEGKTTHIANWQLHPGDNASELRCTYPRDLVSHAGRLGLCGTRDMPCRDRCADRTRAACDPGLVCSAAGEASFTCMAECQSDGDCRLPEVMTCRQGVCRLRDP